jgi:hypothetical protein
MVVAGDWGEGETVHIVSFMQDEHTLEIFLYNIVLIVNNNVSCT